MSRRAAGVGIAIVLAALVGAVAGLSYRRFGGLGPLTAIAPAGKYQCPMHPQIVSDEPGYCPICGMALEAVDGAAPPPAAAAPAERKIIGYRNPMHSDVISPVPATDEMGMAYLPIYEGDTGPGASDVPGHAPFTLTPERQLLIGVTRGRVERKALSVEIRASGRVARDPMLYQAVIEYREALRAKAAIKDSPWFEAHEGAEAVLRSAILKLRQQGISPEQLATLGRGGDPTNLLLPDKNVWIYAQVYEYELDLVRAGQPVTVAVPSLPGRTFDAKVVAVDPVVDPVTRTARIRALVETPQADLRPETFVQATIAVPLGERLVVPAAAVLDTGAHQIVFVVSGTGSFEPRSIHLGRDAQGYYEVLDGVAEGEEVVTSANFLIDSESRFKAALAAFTAAPAHEHETR